MAVFASVATDTDGKAESFIKRLCLYGLTKIRYYEFDFFAPVSWSKAKAFASNSFVSVLLARSGRLLLSGLLLFRLHQFLNQTADSGHCIATRKICRTSDNNIQLIHNAICIVSWTTAEYPNKVVIKHVCAGGSCLSFTLVYWAALLPLNLKTFS